MTPADGSDFVRAAAPVRQLRAPQAILLHGGRALLLIEEADGLPPTAGYLVRGDRRIPWAGLGWQAAGAGGGRGVAMLETVPAAGDLLVGEDGGQWRLRETPRLDVCAEPLAEFVRSSGGPARDVRRFLVDALAARPAGPAEERARRAFLHAFVAAVAEQDGFVEVMAAPHTGGLLAQGWARSIGTGARCLAYSDEDGLPLEVEIAHFSRDDILPPGRGLCCFGKFWSIESIASAEELFFEMDDRLLRLDLLRDATVVLGETATAHVAQMLPRIHAPRTALDAFLRVCRPRFAGTDTLSGTAAPIAAAFDSVFGAPDGGILAMGWLLDPLRRVERAILKSTANFYAEIDAEWCPLPRPDLVRAFAQDSRFTGLLDEENPMHGFIAYAPAQRADLPGAQLYLELVLDDGSCLFRPVVATPFDGAERLPQLLATLSPIDPEIGRIVAGHLAPFLASVAARPRPPVRRPAGRPIPLGRPGGSRDVAAVVPCRGFAEIQPMLALLAGTPEADAIELRLVATREVASAMLPRLEDAFAFYGLAGHLAIASDRESTGARLDAAAAGWAGESILAWTPAALPKGPGWLARLREEATGLPVPGLLSPALVYEDGSIHFGGAAGGSAGTCPLVGYAADWLRRGAPQRTASGAAEVALVDRVALDRAGGFAGRLFGDSHAHLDLADRLHRAGCATWCSGAVEFWVLDEPPAEAATPASAIVRRIDAALIGRSTPGEHSA